MGRALSENSMQFLWFLSSGQSWAGGKVEEALYLYFAFCICISFKAMYLKICLSFRLECDNHETDEDVDHEEGEDDDVDEVEHEDDGPIAFLWSHVSFVGVDGNVENPENIDR